MSVSKERIEDLLERLLVAWRDQDIDTVMSLFTEDCIYKSSVGPEPGETCQGQKQVRGLVEKMFRVDDGSEASIGNLIVGTEQTAAWKWRYRFNDGRVEYGCDFFEFRDGKIAQKDAYRKVAVPPKKNL
ncbi:MAG: nuclear transport factor 2 family protein [Pseudomonadota bacterium]